MSHCKIISLEVAEADFYRPVSERVGYTMIMYHLVKWVKIKTMLPLENIYNKPLEVDMDHFWDTEKTGRVQTRARG